MPRSVNEVVIAGHITTPKQSGRGPVKFSINTGGWKKKDGTKAPDCWHRIVVWPDTQGMTDLDKGQYVKVFGRIEYPPRRESQSLEDFVKWGEFCQIVAMRIDADKAEQPTTTPIVPEDEEGFPF